MGAKIYNSDLTKNLVDGARLMTGSEIVPSELAEKVIPVLDVTPDFHRIANIIVSGACSNVTSVTIYTTPVDRDFYLCSAQLSMIKDVNSTSTYSYLGCTPENGLGCELIYLSELTGTVQIVNLAQNYSTPIKLKRGSDVNLGHSTNVANIVSRAVITGYTI